MSELKAISGHEIREDIDYNTRGIDPENKEWRNYGKELCDTLYYLKSEADKVIAEKDMVIAYAKALVLKDIKLIAHQKYKRCMAMATMCHWKMGVFIYKKEKSDFYYRWHKRWLKIAEKFKEGCVR